MWGQVIQHGPLETVEGLWKSFIALDCLCGIENKVRRCGDVKLRHSHISDAFSKLCRT